MARKAAHDSQGSLFNFLRSSPEDYRSETGCATLFSRGDPMPAPARAKELRVNNLALEELIRRRAYELYLLRGNESGSELDDWLQAEAAHRRSYEEAFDES
jgi:hypothetical protein